MAQPKKNFSNIKAYNGKPSSNTTDTLTNLLKANLKHLKSVLPHYITPNRMARMALNTVRHNPMLCECAPETLLMAIMEAATLGLEIDMRGHAYMVPFWNKKTGTRDVNLIVGYKGWMDLCYRSGEIIQITAEVVCENDRFDYTLGLESSLTHKPALRDRGEIIAAYAIAILKNNLKHFVVLTHDDLAKIRSKSQTPEVGPWNDWEGEMCKKSAIKRLCKYLPMSWQIQRAVALEDASDAGLSQALGETLDVTIEKGTPVAIEASPEQTVTIDMTQPPEKEKVLAHEQVLGNNEEKSFVPIICPNSGKEVSEEVCKACKERQGCPEWETI